MRNVTQVDALGGISFDIEEGELVGYIGPNGVEANPPPSR